jgi:hypothetical protein
VLQCITSRGQHEYIEHAVHSQEENDFSPSSYENTSLGRGSALVLGISRGPVISGMFVALSLLATDYYTLTLGAQSVVIAGWTLPIGLLFSTAFIGSLGFGYLCGQSYIEDNSWKLWIYGIGWLIAISSGVLATFPIDLFTCLLFTTSLILGGFGLAWYYYLKKEIEGDFILIYVLFVNTLINLAYFLWGAHA